MDGRESADKFRPLTGIRENCHEGENLLSFPVLDNGIGRPTHANYGRIHPAWVVEYGSEVDPFTLALLQPRSEGLPEPASLVIGATATLIGQGLWRFRSMIRCLSEALSSRATRSFISQRCSEHPPPCLS